MTKEFTKDFYSIGKFAHQNSGVFVNYGPRKKGRRAWRLSEQSKACDFELFEGKISMKATLLAKIYREKKFRP